MALHVPPSNTTEFDSAPIRGAPWLTPRRLLLFVIAWLVLFAAIGVFVSNPFQSETSAGATPNYAAVMFLHGLLIGMVGLLSLLACQVLALRSLHVRIWVTGGVVAATILAAVGGIWDRTIPGSEVPMWTQIFGFFALDEILIVMLVGLFVEWRASKTTHTLPFVAAALAVIAMLGAAVMGHLAGWIMEFGAVPSQLGSFAHFAGFGSVDDFAAALVGSHSHEMVVGVMALTIVLVAVQFGYGTLTGVSRTLARIGMLLVGAGTVIMMAMYVAGGFSQWQPPTWFVSGPGGANGIASDDVVTGILVMGGGLLIAGALVAGHLDLLRRPVRLAALWSWVLSFATVVIAGYAIEMNTAYFGAGDPTAAGAANDAVFTWLHQDIGLFLLPTLVLVMLAVERLVAYTGSRPNWIGWTTIAGTTLAFVGGMVFVFVDPAIHGSGYVVSTIGLVIVGVALLATLWWGTLVALAVPASAKGAVVNATTQPARTPMVPFWPASTPPTSAAEPADAAEARQPLAQPSEERPLVGAGRER